MVDSRPLRLRTYGTSGPHVIVLHGGPADVGGAEPLAQGLSDSFRVLEPWQRGSGREPLTVARHVADLHEIVQSHCGGTWPGLVGHSWGAMLALAYAAAHPGSAGPLVLVACGTFDSASRARLQETLNERMDDQLKERLKRLLQDFPDPSDRFTQMYKLTKPLYLYDPVTSGTEELAEPFDVRAHEETWEDILRLQEEGVYPAAFAAIESPVLMLHGAFDPHPGRMIRASLAPYLSQLEYREEERWGHYPWLEKGLHDAFFGILREWLGAHLRAGNQKHAA